MTTLSAPLVGVYDYRVVTISLLLAAITSYAALDLAGRLTAARGIARLVWLSGGALALGHPFGGTGCRIVLTLLNELKRRNLKRGIAAICVGGGSGIAVAVERA